MSLSFPSVAGSEGVGIVQKMGEDVTSVNDKDVVMIVKPGLGKSDSKVSVLGTWSEQVVVPEDAVIRAPDGIPVEISSALLNSAGIAYRLLEDFTKLQPGDFVMQNDASSPVGMAVIQLCKARDVKTINVVPDM